MRKMLTKLREFACAPWIAFVIGCLFCGIGTTLGLLAVRRSPGEAMGFNSISMEVGSLIVFFSLPAAMFLGISAHAIWTELPKAAIRGNDDTVDIRKALRFVALSRGFWRSLLVSPIVFAAVYALTRDEPDVIVGHLLAFENGFFWHVVLEGKTPRP